ncbi:MAG: glutathione S-transferase N-terminal domain-containing protein [Aestuariivirga sp.]|nr:glutathione S-transferase N-terminal domain-containing protein [Aestuariivirga sp.]
MLTFYTHNTPNGFKVAIALEELGLDYRIERVNVHAGEQFAPAFKAVNPNAKVPVLVDDETGVATAESNAILLYLAEKTGLLLPKDRVLRQKAIELLFFQAASIGPMFGQRAHFVLFAPEALPYAINRYDTEGERLYDVLETLLEGHEWFLPEYSIVDIAVFGWVFTAVTMGFQIGARPALNAWYARMLARPAVAKGMTIPAPLPAFRAQRAA